jgi:hypothetical protein
MVNYGATIDDLSDDCLAVIFRSFEPKSRFVRLSWQESKVCFCMSDESWQEPKVCFFMTDELQLSERAESKDNRSSDSEGL